MKRKRIPFTVDEYNSGNFNLVTRSGKKARIICMDYNDITYNIITLITTQDNRESIAIYNSSGIKSSGIYKVEENSEDRRDLFLEEFIFEDGDIIVNEDNEIAIFNSDISETNYYLLLSKNKVLLYNYKTEKKKIRLATKEEEQKLFNHLLKENKLWDKEKKCIIHTKYKYNNELKLEDINDINIQPNILYFYSNIKKMSAEGIIELVEYLIGEIKAINIASIDSVNQKNLERLQNVVNTLQGKIIEACKTYK